MGITSFTIELLQPYLREKASTDILELGAQNIFCEPYFGEYASKYYFDAFSMKYDCIDLNGENNAKKIDLSQPAKTDQYDIVTDFGTSEHIEIASKFDWRAIYNCWKTKHNACKVGGYIISENPKTGSWPGHGYNYYTKEFYTKLAELAGYEIKELGEHPAMGNTENGWNVYSVLKKVNDNQFIKFSEFKTLELKQC